MHCTHSDSHSYFIEPCILSSRLLPDGFIAFYFGAAAVCVYFIIIVTCGLTHSNHKHVVWLST